MQITRLSLCLVATGAAFTTFVLPKASASSTTQFEALSTALLGVNQNIQRIKDPADGQTKHLVLAGSRQFKSLWTRDFAFGALGLLAAQDFGPVKDTLEQIYRFQRADGILPRQLDNVHPNLRYLLGSMGLSPAFKPPFKTHFETENGVIAIDGNAAIPWLASQYVVQSRDLVFGAKWFGATELALAHLREAFGVDGLIGKQDPFGDWADSVARTGRVAMTNILYILALRGAAEWAEALGLAERASHYSLLAIETQARFVDFFWIPQLKMLMNFEGDLHLTADANFAAVAYGIVPTEIAEQIMDTMRRSPLWFPMPGRVTYPEYPREMKSRLPQIAGIADYHDKMYWLWLSALAAQAERAIGRVQGCEWVHDQIANLVNSRGAVYEVYNLKNVSGQPVLKPVARPLYHPEVPFTWSSGMIAASLIRGCR